MSKIPTVCLNMIVKNESKIIKRLLDSVSMLIDSYCICDTGSTDDTVQIIEDYFTEKNIQGKIVREPFKNFCHNRNVALQSCIGLSDYVLLLDADMILELNNFNKMLLTTADHFIMFQGTSSFYYQNIRIVKNNGLYKYVGVTHEYIDCPDTTKACLNKDEIFIRDVGDGGCKTNKFERDIALLLDGIEKEPTNVRYYFYLANSYHDSGRFTEAINMYKKRIEMGGWKEEVWYSYYRIGLCYKNSNNFAEALHYWLEGYEYYPERLEAVYEIIKHYRINSKNKLCLTFYKMAKEILKNVVDKDSYLFLQNNVYNYKIYYEYSIFAAYNGIKDINDEIVMIFNNQDNDSELANTLSNMKYYKSILKQKSAINMDNTVHMLINNELIQMWSSSSCLIPNPNSSGYLLNIRYVNYVIGEKGEYHNCDKHIITVNKYVELNSDLMASKEQFFDVGFTNRQYVGTEDIKIYNDSNDKLVFIGTGYHSNNKIGVVSGEYDVNNSQLLTRELTQQFTKSACEKNWVFVNYNHETHVIYNWYPLHICKINDSNNELDSIKKIPMPKLFSLVRGSSCGFSYKNPTKHTDELWFINHIVSYESPRHYYHIISVFDSSMNLLRYSAPFKFEGKNIEYSLSIVVEDSQVLINYSTMDATTRIGIYDKEYIDSIVKYKNT